MWFFDKNLKEDVRLTSEIQMIDLFDMYKAQMSCHFVVGVFDKSVSNAPEFDLLEPLCVIPPDDSAPTDAMLDGAANANTNALPDIPTNATAFPDSPTNANAFPNSNTNANVDEAVDLEPVREPNLFDNEEYVVVDDEHLYTPIPPRQQPTTENVEPVDENSDPVAANGRVPLEAEVDDADPQEIHVLHDPENPKIIKGQLFPDIVSFRKAVRHYAVTKGFEFAKLKTDPTRFVAKCAAEGFPWRIHASRIYDRKTIQV
jgi:hypothetical protein